MFTELGLSVMPACVPQYPTVRQAVATQLGLTSAGQAPVVPEQLSATSQALAIGRQIVVADRKPSTHVLAVPKQESGPSHAPPFDAPTQVVVAGWKPSAGQAPVEPEQLSATSQAPAEARQIVVADRKPSTHVLEVPAQESVPSHAPPFDAPTQIVVAGWKPSPGQTSLVPVQLSGTSH
jgi:hypothetical protein